MKLPLQLGGPRCQGTLPSSKTKISLLALPTAATLGALGIVYGDIGTSPLYAFRTAIKAASVDGSPTPEAVLGALADYLVVDSRLNYVC